MSIINDSRSIDTRPAKDVALWYVATDTFMSGWGLAKGGSSYVAYPADTETDNKTLNMMHERHDFIRVRTNLHLPRLGANDHLSIYDNLTAKETNHG